MREDNVAALFFHLLFGGLFLSLIWKRFSSPYWTKLPEHLRTGFLRLYIAVSVPWLMWFGYRAYDSTQRRLYYWPDVAAAGWWVLIWPVGAPILVLVVLWVTAGFQGPARESNKDSTAPEPASHRSMADYYPIIARAVASLTENTPQARQAVYDRARSVLLTQLDGQHARIGREQKSLEAAIHKIEIAEKYRDRTTREPIIARKASTALLLVSMFFPQVWLMDATCMSVWWVARLPKGKRRPKGSGVLLTSPPLFRAPTQ